MATWKGTKKSVANDPEPPAPDQTTQNLGNKPRTTEGTRSTLQFSVPQAVIDEFGQEAGRVFGFTKGAKSSLFIKLWEDYKANIS